MTDKHSDRLMHDLKAAKPAPRLSAQEWVDSDRGQQVLARVLASAEAEAQKGVPDGQGRGARRMTQRASFRMALAAAVLVLAVVGVTLSLVFTSVTDPGTGENPVVVTKVSAVQHVMQLVHVVTSWTGESLGTATTSQASLLAEAVERGLITASEIETGSTTEPLLEGEFVELLWQAFGGAFPVMQEIDTPLKGLQNLGVVKDSDGAFLPDQPLTGERERLLLTRMQAALRGEVSD